MRGSESCSHSSLFQFIHSPYECTCLQGTSPSQISKQMTIRHAEWDMSSENGRNWKKEREFIYLKLSMVKCQECGLFVACGHIYASWCHPTAVCLGGSTHTPTHRPSYSCSLQPLTVSPLSVLKYCQTLLALRPLLIVISISSSVRRAFHLPFPCRYLTFTQSFAGFTHLFTRCSDFFFSFYVLLRSVLLHISQFLSFSESRLGHL